MKERLQNFLYSEKTMKVVNLLFLLSLLFRGIGIIYLAYLLWIVYLTLFIRRMSSKVLKIWNGLLIGLASVMILVNLYFMLGAARG